MSYDRLAIQKLHHQAKDSPYLLTMPLILSSLLKDDALYRSIREDFLNHFKLVPSALIQADAIYHDIISKITTQSDKDTFCNTWLWGRYLLAANTLDPDSNETRHLKHILKELFQRECRTLDKSALPFYVWAKGYLLSTLADDAEYQTYLASLQNDIDIQIAQQDDIENCLWSLVMAFSAAGTHDDRDFFEKIKTQLFRLTKRDSLIDALHMIPPGSNGYRVWAFAIVQQAAIQLEEQAVSSEIESEWDCLIDNKDETVYGKALASLIKEKAPSLKPYPF